MSATEEQLGTVGAALANARRLLRTNPALAQQQAIEILNVEPRHPGGHLALGLAHAGLGQHEAAVDALRRATDLDPGSAAAWRALADQLTILEDAAGADAAYAHSIKASVTDPRLQEAARALIEGKLAVAEAPLRAHLKAQPTDVAAIRMLAEVGARLGRFEDAEKLLARCLQLAPSFTAARHNFALVLHRQSKASAALKQIDILLDADPDNPSYRFLRASALARIGEYAASIELYESILRQHPNNARGWLSLGHARKTAGRQQESIEAYARSIAIAPKFGEGYWSLANMKTYRFDDATVAAMQAQLKRADLGEEDRFHLHYALGKAFEDRDDHARAFEHYQLGAKLRRAGLAYDAEENAQATREHAALFTKDFFASRAGRGAGAPDPIFIVGLPRSGSTLL
ncbi:MAG: tetratricopeptide repeat protein, partial [Vitreimonas sp.]